jgi:hypothetical protein
MSFCRLNTELKSEEGRIDKVTKLFSDSPPLILGEMATDSSQPSRTRQHPHLKQRLLTQHPALPVTQLSEGDTVMNRLVRNEDDHHSGGAVGGRERAEAEAASFAHLTAGARDPHAAAKARLVRKVAIFAL